MIPWQIKHALRKAIEAPARRAHWKALQALCWEETSGLLGLAGALDSGHVHGGAVKLLHLKDRYGDVRSGFRVLYLVSSALPRFWMDTARWARAHGARIVWNQNGVAYPAWAGKEYPRWNLPMRSGVHMASHVIYQSHFCRQSADRYLGPPRCPVDVLLNPVDLNAFHPRNRIPSENGELRLLAMGTHASPERVRLALETLKRLITRGHRTSLTVAGPLEWRGAQTDINVWLATTETGRHTAFIGRFTQTEAPLILAGHDLLIHAKPMDPCPTAVAEALASGVPVVARNNGGLPEMVPPDAGVLVPSSDTFELLHHPSAEDFAHAVERIATDLAAAGRNARAWAEKAFDRETWVRAHERILTVALNRQ